MAQNLAKGQTTAWAAPTGSSSAGGLQKTVQMQPTAYKQARSVAMGQAPVKEIKLASGVSQPKGYEGARKVAMGQAPIVPIQANYQTQPWGTVLGTRPNPTQQQAAPAGGGGGMPSGGGMSMGDLAGMLSQMMGGGGAAAAPEPKPEKPKPEPGTGPGWVDPRDPLSFMGGGTPAGDVLHGTGLIEQMIAAAPAMPQRGDPSAGGPKVPIIPAKKTESGSSSSGSKGSSGKGGGSKWGRR